MHLIVVGGGAAGFFCAVNAARLDPSLRVTIVEKTGKLLSKVRISGGGRCNVTHACFSIDDMKRNYPRGEHFVKKAFHRFFTTDCIAWFAGRGVKLKTEADGRMFPVTDDSDTIVRCLLDEAARHGVVIRTNTGVRSLANSGGRWMITTDSSEVLEADFLCIATGGYPKEQMFSWLKATGHSVQAPVPSLFTFNLPGAPITSLTGIATRALVRLSHPKLSEEGPLLITHWGISGPAVLRLSARGARELHDLDYQFDVRVNWCPQLRELEARQALESLRGQQPSRKLTAHGEFGMPQRLWQYLVAASGISETARWSEVSGVLLGRLATNCTAHTLHAQGKTTFREEFVTAGGITLSEIDPQTMRSRIHDNLYFAGEVMDVDGVTGGFNFQHAWTSGWVAASAIAERSLARS